MVTEKETTKKEKLKHITVKISEDIHKKLKLKSVMDGLTMRELMEKLIAEATKRPRSVTGAVKIQW